MAVSVIVPAYREGKNLIALAGYLRNTSDAEIIISAYQVENTILKQCRELGVYVHLSEKKGRSQQMNAGAKRASNKILFFLHADCRPPENWYPIIVNTIGPKQALCFRIKFDWQQPYLNFFAWCTRFNFISIRFGDQGLVVWAEDFENSTGFDPNRELLEDQDMVRRLQRMGVEIKMLKTPMQVSARKYREKGILKLQWLYFKIWLAYRLQLSGTAFWERLILKIK